MRGKFARVIYGLVAGFLTLYMTLGLGGNAGALNNILLRQYALSNSFYYNPEGNCVDNTSGKLCVAPSGDQITWIGDSLTALGGEGKFTSTFEGVDFGDTFNGTSINDYIRSGKRIDLGTEMGGAGGLDILKNIISQGKLRPFLVFALGANSTWDTCTYEGGACIDKLMEMVGDTQVIILTTKTIAPHAMANGGYDSNNNYLKSADERYEHLTVGDWAGEVLDRFYISDGTHYTEEGYQAYYDFVKTSLPMNCSAGVLPGNTAEEKVWNYFVKADIDGVSDNAAVIAGIIGNLKLESGLDPFMVSGGYYGIHMTQREDFKAVIDNAGLGQYWGQGSNAPAEAVEKAIELELDWITQNNPRWFGGSGPGGDYWAENAAFLPNLNNVDDTNSPESYSDLFLVTVEGANYQGFGSETELTDSKVRALAASVFAGDNGLWQGAKQRRDYARQVYDELSGGAITAVSNNTKSAYTTMQTLSVSGHTKYDMTDGEIESLAKFAVWLGGQKEEKFQDILSRILDDYEASNSGEKGDSGALLSYIQDSDSFKYRNEYNDFATLSSGITLSSEQIETAHKIINQGLRTTTGSNVQVISNNALDNICKPDNANARGAARIAQVAVQMSWPVITPEYSEEQGHAGECATDGRDSTTYNSWIKYSGRGSECDYTPRKLYRENYSGQVSANVFNAANGFPDRKYMDCSWFVGTVMKYLFGVEYGYPQGGPSLQMGFMESHPEDWQIIPNHDSLDDLQPGDVLAYSTGGNHIMIYVGEYGGEYGEWAQASADEIVGMVETKGSSGWGHFTIYRYVGTALGSAGNCDQFEGGEAVACAAEYMAWPNTAEGWAKAEAGQLTPEYEAARDKWFGAYSNALNGQDNDVSCARFASLVILESGADPEFAVSSSPNRANIKWLGGQMESYMASSPNWEDVTAGSYQRGDVFINAQPHVWIYLGDGLIAEAAGGRSGFNRAGAIMTSNGSNASYKVYRVRK